MHAPEFPRRFALGQPGDAGVQIPAMYDQNFKPKFFTDITMPTKLFVGQILARYFESIKFLFSIV